MRRIDSPLQSQDIRSNDSKTVEPNLRFLMLPQTKTTRFFDRLEIFDYLDQALHPTVANTSLQSVTMHGLGGVGKSTIASAYVQKKFEENVFDVCLWVCGEESSSLRESFTGIAMRLKLDGAQQHNHDENLILVQDWFQSTGKSKSQIVKIQSLGGLISSRNIDCRWLIVYDNVETLDVLEQYWPVSSRGRAIITTRNRSMAFQPACSGLEITSWDAQAGSQFFLFLLKNGIGCELEVERNSAFTLSDRLGGHALAISHMASLIHDGELSIHEFMTMYMKDPRGFHAINELVALWDFSFKSLDQNCLSLLGVLSYLMPDNIPQRLFETDIHGKLPSDLDFCSDSFGYVLFVTRLCVLWLNTEK